MEFETVSGNKKNIEKLKKRVMEYLEKAYDVTPSSDDEWARGKPRKETGSLSLINLFLYFLIYLINIL